MLLWMSTGRKNVSSVCRASRLALLWYDFVLLSIDCRRLCFAWNGNLAVKWEYSEMFKCDGNGSTYIL